MTIESKSQSVNADDFFSKILRVLGQIPFARDIVAMYFALIDDATPIWARAQIAAAIAYFLMPFDAIPDMIVPFGYADDAGVVAAALALVGAHVGSRHYREADKFFGTRRPTTRAAELPASTTVRKSDPGFLS